MSTGELKYSSDNAVEVDTLTYDYISGLQQQFNSKLYNPDLDESATERLIEQREAWRTIGAITVFTSGVFDMLHPDHAGYLLHTKAVGAAELYRRSETSRKPWEELDASVQQSFTNIALSNGSLRLIVSIDGDKSVAIRKGFNPDKGNATRPIYAWQTRAFQVAQQCYISPQGGDKLLPTVDAITTHGPHDFTEDSLHKSHLALVEALQPDVWAVFGESTDVLEQAPKHSGLGGVALRCILDGSGTHYFEDTVIGKMSTTNIINRIKAGE